MTTPMKLAWWLTFAATLAVWVFAYIRLHAHAWTSGGLLVALTVGLAVALRLTCDDAMGASTI